LSVSKRGRKHEGEVEKFLRQSGGRNKKWLRLTKPKTAVKLASLQRTAWPQVWPKGYYFTRENLALEQLAVLTRIPSEVTYGQLRLHPYWVRFVAIRALKSWLLLWRLPHQQKSFLPASDNAAAADFLENKIARRYSTLAMRNCFRP
jgi:hypothetical protein